MRRFLQEIEDLHRRKPGLEQAAFNVRNDIRSEENLFGNLGATLVAQLDEECRRGTAVEQAIEEHRCTLRPELHRRCVPPPRVRRIMAQSDFVRYHVLRGAADQSEMGYWVRRLQPGSHRFDGSDLRGWTGRVGGPCWWHLEESERPPPSDGRVYVAELALGESQRDQAEEDGAVVEVTIDRDAVSDQYFKPTALEGFGPETPFRPELSGAEYGRTVPEDHHLQGWPEAVSESAEYVDVLDDDDEIEVRVLTYRDSGIPEM